MGALSVTGRNSDEGQPLDDDAHEAAPAEREAPPEHPTEQDRTVPASQLLPETAASRRERLWQERVHAQVKPIEERFTNELRTRDEQLAAERQARAQQAETLARLQGQIEAMQRQPAQQQAQPQGPDPDKLFADADEALRNNDISGYHAKQRAAYQVLATRQAQEAARQVREEIQRSLPPQVPPQIQALLFNSPHVRDAGDKGIRAVIRMEQELEDEGVPQGYARTAEAFKRVNEKLTPKAKATPPARPQYSQDAAAALSAIPTSRGAASSGGEGDVKLTTAQWAAYKADGTFKSPAEYLQWADPHKFGLIKQK
jgi:hypothetical protein